MLVIGYSNPYDINSMIIKIDNQKSAIVYEDVYSNVDFEYEISSNQIKESIVLNSKQDKNKFEFTVDNNKVSKMQIKGVSPTICQVLTFISNCLWKSLTSSGI